MVVGNPVNATKLNNSQPIATDQYIQDNRGQPMNAKRDSRQSYKVLANSQLDAEIKNMKDLAQEFKATAAARARSREQGRLGRYTGIWKPTPNKSSGQIPSSMDCIVVAQSPATGGSYRS